MKRRLASLLGITAITATFAVGGANPAHAAPGDCTKGYGYNYGYANCDGAYADSFKVGVKCLKPGNVYYWNWSPSYLIPSGREIVYCNPGHVAKGVNVQVSVWF